MPNITTATFKIPTQELPVTVEVMESRNGLADALLSREVKKGNINSNKSKQGSAPNEPIIDDSVDGVVVGDVEGDKNFNRQLLVFFTGNPGMVQFYIPLANKLVAEAAEGRAVGKKPAPYASASSSSFSCSSNHTPPTPIALDVLVIGFAGHSAEELNHDRVFVLKDQEAMATVLTTALMKSAHIYRGDVDATNTDKNNNDEEHTNAADHRFSYQHIYFGGHSIGAYIATIVTDVHRDDPLLTRAFLLAPTLCYMRDSPEGKSKGPHMKSAAKVAATAFLGNSLRCLLPAMVIKWIVEFGEPSCKANPHAASAVQNVLRYGTLKNVLVMAKSELDDVYELDSERLNRIRSKVVAWFPKDDHWSPLPFYREIAAALRVLTFTTAEINNGAKERLIFGDGWSEDHQSNSNAGSSPSPPQYPVCAIDSSDVFVHAWCLAYTDEVAMMMVLPYLSI